MDDVSGIQGVQALALSQVPQHTHTVLRICVLSVVRVCVCLLVFGYKRVSMLMHMHV